MRYESTIQYTYNPTCSIGGLCSVDPYYSRPIITQSTSGLDSNKLVGLDFGCSTPSAIGLACLSICFSQMLHDPNPKSHQSEIYPISFLISNIFNKLAPIEYLIYMILNNNSSHRLSSLTISMLQFTQTK